jgi:hypothetical protein
MAYFMMPISLFFQEDDKKPTGRNTHRQSTPTEFETRHILNSTLVFIKACLRKTPCHPNPAKTTNNSAVMSSASHIIPKQTVTTADSLKDA